MLTLTQVRAAITAARQLPEEQRRAAAAALLPDVDVVLAGVSDLTRVQTWAHLARIVEPRTAVQADPASARRLAVDLIAGRDPLAPLRAAADADDDAQRAAADARDALRRAAVAAVADGARPTVVGEICKITPKTLYAWLDAAQGGAAS